MTQAANRLSLVGNLPDFPGENESLGKGSGAFLGDSCDAAAMVNIKRRMLLSVFKSNRGSVRECKKVSRLNTHRSSSVGDHLVSLNVSQERQEVQSGGTHSRHSSATTVKSHRLRPTSTQRFFETECEFETSSEDCDEAYTDDSEIRSVHEMDGEEISMTTYIAACQSLGIVPANFFLQNLQQERLVMKHHILGAEGAKACAIALVNNNSVKQLDLSGNNIQCQGAAYIAEMLTWNENITSLTLSENNISSYGLHELTEMLKDSFAIKTLNLSGNGFLEKDACCIADMIVNNHSIEDLDLSHNCFSDKGGVIIGAALGKNDTLITLDLSWNHLRGKGAVAITDGIKANKYLKCVALAWNGLSHGGCVGLGSMLEHNQTLTSLDLTNNRINKEHVLHLLRGLKRNSTLITLKLGLNPLSSDGAMSILEVMKQCPDMALAELDLTGQCVEDKFVDMLEELQTVRVLSVIYDVVLQQCDITQEDEEFLNEDPMMVLMEFMRQKNMRLVDLFTKLDADGSKSLSRQEFKDGLLSVNIPMSPKALDKLLDNLDKDGDGEVDFAELMEGQKEYRRKVTKITQRRSSITEDDEITRISRKVSTLLLATDAAKKFSQGGDASKDKEHNPEEMKMLSMSRKVQSLLKVKNAVHQGGPKMT